MEALFDIFIKYGWFGIIGIVLCIILFYCAKLMIYKIDKNMTSGLEDIGQTLTQEISKQNEKLVSTMIDQQHMLIDHIVNQNNTEKKNHSDKLGKRIELSDEINLALKDIMNIHNSQRAFILEFHNSYQNLSGTPFAKYSCTYEWFEKGLSPLIYKCVGLPFSSIAHVVNQVMKSKKQQVIYDNLKLLEETSPGLYSLFKEDDTKEIIYTAMYDKNNIFIGLLVLEYKEKPAKINLNQLHIQAAELTSILNLRYKYSD